MNVSIICMKVHEVEICARGRVDTMLYAVTNCLKHETEKIGILKYRRTVEFKLPHLCVKNNQFKLLVSSLLLKIRQ